MLDEQRLPFFIDQVVFPGASLCFHAKYIHNIDKESFSIPLNNETPTTINKILKGKWNLVILQDVSMRLLIPEYRIRSFDPSFIYFDSVIKSINAKPIIFEGYARNIFPIRYSIPKIDVLGPDAFDIPNTLFSYDQSLDYNIGLYGNFYTDSFANSDEEYKIIAKEYEKVALKLNAKMIKVGFVFELFKKKYQNIKLYESIINYHPSKQGSYLIACLFFKYLTGKNLQHVKYSADLNPKEAQLIRKFADTIH